MSYKILYIHAGGAKTGSSALQSFLEMRVDRFARHGFAYENRLNLPVPATISSGNGYALYEQLWSGNASDDEVAGMVLSYFGGQTKAICSSEYFAELGVSQWNRLWAICARLGVEAHVIFYVRNVLGYMQSAYDQMVKRHGEWRQFDDWVVDAEWQHARALMLVSGKLPRDRLHVLHYEREQADLYGSFLRALGVPADGESDWGGGENRINRSLTNYERETLLALNGKLRVIACAGDASDDLSTMLITRYPDRPGNPPACNDATLAMLVDKFSADVGWINGKFFGGNAVVSVTPRRGPPRPRVAKRTADAKNDAYVDSVVLEWALGKLATIKEQEQGRMVNALVRAAQMNVRGRPDLPRDFDPVVYLLMNPDVLLAGVDPVVHFITFGWQESRQYKFRSDTHVQAAACCAFQQMEATVPREDKALHFCDRGGLGLEIGPSHNPVAPKSKGYRVHVLDHLDAAGLREKYRAHGVNLDNIEEVDFVWRGESLTELIGQAECYDWIIASHVIEHVPDLISFLQQCEALLKPNGVLSLIIPDRRYCFDYFMPSTTTGSVLDAFAARRVMPSSGQVFDHFANAANLNGNIAWSANDYGAYGLVHSFASAKELWEQARPDSTYIDVHCWRFTPVSFSMVLGDLRDLGLLDLGVRAMFDTVGNEFHVFLEKNAGEATPADRLHCLEARKSLDA